ncbi:MAG TPA: hypothetical protein VN812_01060 [Candidatus Acidoferrales bacterium]|nr:hypothetical protein [Candidatus Acidoferrales bacterium]
MDKPNERTDRAGKAGGPRVFVYHGALPPALALLLVAPLLFVFLSIAAVVVTGGALAAFVLPIVLRGRNPRRGDDDVITLERDQYSHVRSEPRQLPPR